MIASIQEPNRPDEHFTRAMRDLAPFPLRSIVVPRVFRSSSKSSPEQTWNETGRIAVSANLSRTPLLSSITTADFVALTPKIMREKG